MASSHASLSYRTLPTLFTTLIIIIITTTIIILLFEVKNLIGI